MVREAASRGQGLQIRGGGTKDFYGRTPVGEVLSVSDHQGVVAYEPSVSLRMGLSGGVFSSFFSGEGLVTRLRGPGRVYLQSRSLEGLASWTNSYL